MSVFTDEQINEIMSIFTQNLGHRQYIGSRYVPIFGRVGEDSIAWDNTGSYEPLTIVLHQGNSYTSRQYVPAGVAITNTDYWAETGNYNAQIEQYRNEVLAFGNRIDTVEDDIDAVEGDITRLDGYFPITTSELADAAVTTDKLADAAVTPEKISFERVVLAEDYGAIGDGVTDCTTALQNAIDENPNTAIKFKGGVYIISDTVFLNGDIDSTTLDLCGATIKWGGSSSVWSEGQAVTLKADHMGIMDNPIVMFAIERRHSTGEPGRPAIVNGTINCDLKADIAIQNVSFLPVFENLRISNFMYAGIFNGTYDGQTYDMTGTVVSADGRSTQTMIDSCYFTRLGDMAARNASAIFITYPDNQIDNIVTNRTRYGITMRIGGNSVSNSHITIEYTSTPALADFIGSSVRLWPFASGDTQFNIFENCYFNVGRYVFYAYKDSNQAFAGANLRTMASNCHYTFYSSAQFGERWTGAWFGGLWYGICVINQCGNITGDYVNFLPYYIPNLTPSIQAMRFNEWKFANVNLSHPHGALVDSSNLCDGEWQFFNNNSNPLPAGQYKRIARINTHLPVGSNGDLIPGTIEIECAMRNGGFYRKAVITRVMSTDNIQVHIDADESIGSVANMTLYYLTTGINQYSGTVSHDIFAYNPSGSDVTDVRLLKVTCSDPSTHVYMLPDAANYSSSDYSNRNIYGSIADLQEIF